MRLIAIIVILFSLVSCQTTDTAHSTSDNGVGNGRELAPVWPESGPILLAKPLSQRRFDTLQNDEIVRWKQIAVEAATSTEVWSRFGGQRFIEGLFNVDPTRIKYYMLGKDCANRGGDLYIENNANCDDIKLIVPTDQRSACASFFIEVIVARESGKVVNLKDSFSTLSQTERIENGCLTRLFDKPVWDKFSLFK